MLQTADAGLISSDWILGVDPAPDVMIGNVLTCGSPPALPRRQL